MSSATNAPSSGGGSVPEEAFSYADSYSSNGVSGNYNLSCNRYGSVYEFILSCNGTGVATGEVEIITGMDFQPFIDRALKDAIPALGDVLALTANNIVLSPPLGAVTFSVDRHIEIFLGEPA